MRKHTKRKALLLAAQTTLITGLWQTGASDHLHLDFVNRPNVDQPGELERQRRSRRE